MKKRLLLLLTLFSTFQLLATVQDSIGTEKVDEVTFVKYLVTPKETIYRLSTTHSISIEQLMTDNPELENGLKVGQVIKLRNYERTQAKEETLAISDSPFETKKRVEPTSPTHVVEKGETLYGLSKKYGIPLNDLMRWNGLELKTGQVLVVKDPAKTSVKTVEKVKTTSAEIVKTTEAPAPVVEKKIVEKTEPIAKKEPLAVVKEKTKEAPAVEKPKATPPPAPKKAQESAPKTEELLSEKDIYEYDPNKQQVLIVPFDPHLYFSDADDEIMRGSNLKSRLEVRKTIRRRLNALLDPRGFENIHLMGGRFRDTLTDLNKIYSSVSYDYQDVILSEEYKKTLAAQEVANKKDGEIKTKKSLKDRFSKLNSKIKEKLTTPTKEDKIVIDKSKGKYFGVLIKDQKFFDYFKTKYSIDYYIFINQFEVITDYDHCLDRTTENYRRYFVVHFSIFDHKGHQIAGNKYRLFYDSNSNNIDKITGDNMQEMADRILLELPKPF